MVEGSTGMSGMSSPGLAPRSPCARSSSPLCPTCLPATAPRPPGTHAPPFAHRRVPSPGTAYDTSFHATDQRQPRLPAAAPAAYPYGRYPLPSAAAGTTSSRPQSAAAHRGDDAPARRPGSRSHSLLGAAYDHDSGFDIDAILAAHGRGVSGGGASSGAATSTRVPKYQWHEHLRGSSPPASGGRAASVAGSVQRSVAGSVAGSRAGGVPGQQRKVDRVARYHQLAKGWSKDRCGGWAGLGGGGDVRVDAGGVGWGAARARGGDRG